VENLKWVGHGRDPLAGGTCEQPTFQERITLPRGGMLLALKEPDVTITFARTDSARSHPEGARSWQTLPYPPPREGLLVNATAPAQKNRASSMDLTERSKVTPLDRR